MNTRTSFGRDFQEGLLERLRDRQQVTTLYLRNRMALRGRIVEFDPFVLLLAPLDGTPAVLVYKSAVVSVSGPNRPEPPGRRAPRAEGPYRGGPASSPMSTAPDNEPRQARRRDDVPPTPGEG